MPVERITAAARKLGPADELVGAEGPFVSSAIATGDCPLMLPMTTVSASAKSAFQASRPGKDNIFLAVAERIKVQGRRRDFEEAEMWVFILWVSFGLNEFWFHFLPKEKRTGHCKKIAVD